MKLGEIWIEDQYIEERHEYGRQAQGIILPKYVTLIEYGYPRKTHIEDYIYMRAKGLDFNSYLLETRYNDDINEHLYLLNDPIIETPYGIMTLIECASFAYFTGVPIPEEYHDEIQERIDEIECALAIAHKKMKDGDEFLWMIPNKGILK